MRFQASPSALDAPTRPSRPVARPDRSSSSGAACRRSSGPVAADEPSRDPHGAVQRIARALACWIALLCVAPLVGQADIAQRLDAVQEFKRYFRKFKETNEKVEAVRTLEGNECVPAAEELLELLDHKTVEIAKAAADVLTTYKSQTTFQALIDSLPTLKDAQQQAKLIEVFGRSEVVGAAPAVAAVVLESRTSSGEVKFAAARAFGAFGRNEHAEPVLAALLGDGDAIVRMAALDSAAKLDVRGVGPRVVELLGDSAWQVKLAAVHAAGVLRVVEAVVPLIAIMEEGGRAVEECADALFHITGMDLGTDAASWRSMWERLSSIPTWRIPTDEELAKKAASRKRYDALYGATDKGNEFGGIKTTSTRILFVIDISGSMDDLVTDREKFDAGYADFTKLTIVKTELERTVDGLDGNTLFNIAAFATEVKPWKNFLVPANVVNKASAIAFIRKLECIGGKEAQGLAGAGLGGSANLEAGKTNTHAALMYAFGVDPSKPDTSPTTRGAVKSNLDTVFFLSDGRPSVGKHVDEHQILREVNELNAMYRITFHVIAIGDFHKAFMQQLAESNGGVFVDLGH